jgi:hypothetical protein
MLLSRESARVGVVDFLTVVVCLPMTISLCFCAHRCRFSGSTRGCTLSWVNETQAGRKLLHIRVKQTADGFSLPTEDPSVYPSLLALINALVMQEKLRSTSLTNPYEHLFRETLADMGSYAGNISDDWTVVGSLSQSESPPGKRQRITQTTGLVSTQ